MDRFLRAPRPASKETLTRAAKHRRAANLGAPCNKLGAQKGGGTQKKGCGTQKKGSGTQKKVRKLVLGRMGLETEVVPALKGPGDPNNSEVCERRSA
ncbi:hypothetical protein MJO29_005306 [Puccinia striiformis f. sp. tritici]|nr:hypothetical protein MJO29_005306 [Puccinia striiformis f. sp. tritici]